MPSKKHNGLITYILGQLQCATNNTFIHYVHDLQFSFEEGTLKIHQPTSSLMWRSNACSKACGGLGIPTAPQDTQTPP